MGWTGSKMKIRRLPSKTILRKIQSGVCRSTLETLPFWQNRLLQASHVRLDWPTATDCFKIEEALMQSILCEGWHHATVRPSHRCDWRLHRFTRLLIYLYSISIDLSSRYPKYGEQGGYLMKEVLSAVHTRSCALVLMTINIRRLRRLSCIPQQPDVP